MPSATMTSRCTPPAAATIGGTSSRSSGLAAARASRRGFRSAAGRGARAAERVEKRPRVPALGDAECVLWTVLRDQEIRELLVGVAAEPDQRGQRAGAEMFEQITALFDFDHVETFGEVTLGQRGIAIA